MLTTRLRLGAAVATALLAALALGSAPTALAASSSPSPSPSTTAAPGTPGGTAKVTFGIGPSTKKTIDRRPNFNVLAPRGTTVSDEVAVVNLTTESLTLNLYASDAVNGVDGTLGLEPSATTPKDAAAWVTFKAPGAKGFVVVPARSTVFVPFTVKIPAKAYVGDHLAGIVASTVTKGSQPGERTTDVTLEQRIAVRLGVRVAGELTPELSVENVSAEYSGSLLPLARGTATVTYTVRNTGNVRLGGHQTVSVKGIVGPTAVSADLQDVPLLLPGGSATVSVPVRDVMPVGLMTATVTIDPLGAVGDANPESAPAEGTTSFWAVPWTLIALLILLIILLAWLWRRRRPAPPVGGRRSPARPADLVDA